MGRTFRDVRSGSAAFGSDPANRLRRPLPRVESPLCRRHSSGGHAAAHRRSAPRPDHRRADRGAENARAAHRRERRNAGAARRDLRPRPGLGAGRTFGGGLPPGRRDRSGCHRPDAAQTDFQGEPARHGRRHAVARRHPPGRETRRDAAQIHPAGVRRRSDLLRLCGAAHARRRRLERRREPRQLLPSRPRDRSRGNGGRSRHAKPGVPTARRRIYARLGRRPAYGGRHARSDGGLRDGFGPLRQLPRNRRDPAPRGVELAAGFPHRGKLP